MWYVEVAGQHPGRKWCKQGSIWVAGGTSGAASGLYEVQAEQHPGCLWCMRGSIGGASNALQAMYACDGVIVYRPAELQY